MAKNKEVSEHLPLNDMELDTLLSGRRAVRVVNFIPLDRQIGIKALTDWEVDQAQLEAQRYCKRVGADVEMDPAFLEREKERQFVWRSIVEPHPSGSNGEHRPLFASDEDVRKKLDTALVRAFFNAYMDVLDELTPVFRLNDQEVQELVRSLGKGHDAPATALRHYAHDTLRGLVLTMARSLYEQTSTTGK